MPNEGKSPIYKYFSRVIWIATELLGAVICTVEDGIKRKALAEIVLKFLEETRKPFRGPAWWRTWLNPHITKCEDLGSSYRSPPTGGCSCLLFPLFPCPLIFSLPYLIKKKKIERRKNGCREWWALCAGTGASAITLEAIEKEGLREGKGERDCLLRFRVQNFCFPSPLYFISP